METKNQRVLRSLILTISLAGILLLTMSYIQNLSKGVATNDSVDTTGFFGLKPGQYTFEKTKNSNGEYVDALFVYRYHLGEVRIWSVPMKEGKVGMPDKTWRQPTYACMDFGPTVIQGAVDESQPITCHDLKAKQHVLHATWQWDIKGRNISGETEDLPVLDRVVE